MFCPTEIIFSPTTSCNLHCPHCFVDRQTQKLEIEAAKKFILSCKENSSQIYKIGFTGGEPFLYQDFLLEITKFTVQQDLMFDQVMTNGDWWKNDDDLKEVLQKLYDAGYDGKIGLSWDNFHGQTTDRMTTFIKTAQAIFGEDSISIQYVDDSESNCEKKITATQISALFQEVPLYILPQTFPSSDHRAWESRHWFKEDYCEGPGQILFIHPDGNIAPCCGFANEDSQLFIGTINDDFETVMKKAAENPMIKICYETGLLKYRKELKKHLKQQGKKIPGKCGDICSFCDFVCKNQ